MKLIRVDFDADEAPERVTFEMSLTEAALVYQLTGRIGPIFVTEAAGGDQKWGDATTEIAECVGGFFNRFYDAGVVAVAPRFGVVDIAARKAARDD